MADGKTFTKAEVDAAIEAAVGKVQESIDKLTSKNEELIGENRKLKRGAEIKPEDLTAAEERADKAETALAAALKAGKDATTAAEKATKALEAESAFTQKLLIQDGLKSALIAAGVKDEDHLDVLSAKYASGAKVVVEGEERKAMIGDKPLADFFKDWAGTDTAKKYIQAPINGGGGGPGSKIVTEAAKTVTRAEFNAMSQPDRSKHSTEGGKVVDAPA